jgi:hypothetical protein
MLNWNAVSKGNLWFTLPIVRILPFIQYRRLLISAGSALLLPSLCVSILLFESMLNSRMSSGVILYVSAVQKILNLTTAYAATSIKM